MNIVIAGIRQTGKTTAASTLVEKLKANGKTVSGFLCPENKIVNLATGKNRQFLYKEEQPNAQTVGPYWIPQEALTFAEKAANTPADIVFIDEYGKLELHEQGIYPTIKKAWKKNNCIVLMKDINLTPFLERFGKCKVFIINKENRDALPDELYKQTTN